MGARDDTLRMLKQEGLSPAEISKRRGVSLRTTLAYLDQMVGEGKLRRSDILFSVPPEKREAIARAMAEGCPRGAWNIHKALEKSGVKDVTQDEVLVVLSYGDAGHALGDMYEDIRTIEVGLHRFIQEVLEREFGRGESGWWRQGIPAEIRKACQARREDDPQPADAAYCYTDLIDLRTVLEKQWSTLSKSLPGGVACDRKALLADLLRLNHIRRMVMHPVRGGVPSEQDFEFLRGLKQRLGFEGTVA
jgi:hypothetical protein